MQRQVHSKTKRSKKTPAKRKARTKAVANIHAAPHAPPRKAHGGERSPLHWHTSDELVRLEEIAKQRAGDEAREMNRVGFVVIREEGGFEVKDDLAEQLTEEFLISAMRGEETHAILSDEGDEEALGPVIEVSGAKQFAGGTDDTNSEDTLRESLPTAGNWNVSRSDRSKRPS